MKGLLFTPEMAVAACAGRKTQTRRVIVPQPEYEHGFWIWRGKPIVDFSRIPCDYQPGERRCLLTTWAVASQFDGKKPLELSPRISAERIWHAGMGTPKPNWAGKLRPGRFLPNHLRPLMPVFEIGSVRYERVQDISAEDARREGIRLNQFEVWHWRDDSAIGGVDARDAYRLLWDSINAEPGPVAGDNGAVRYVSYPWDGRPETKTHRGQPWTVVPNPWVWGVEFAKHER